MSVTREQFMQQKNPRPGQFNPERMNCEFWELMIRNERNAYWARKEFGWTGNFEDGPIWCFDRFGMSRTKLPDGREVCIAGEHEDFYDPDFYIYNDVIVLHPNGAIDIYGYPFEEFIPTDFHSATLVGDNIYIVGCLGYSHYRARIPGLTPVFRLNCTTFRIEEVETAGEAPGWIYKHEATFDPAHNALVIARGKVVTRQGEQEQRDYNTGIHRLDLNTLQWSKIGDAPVPAEEIERDREIQEIIDGVRRFDLNTMQWVKISDAPAEEVERDRAIQE